MFANLIWIISCLIMFPQLPWGAYPRHTPHDIQSGIGKIGNSYGFKGVTKAVTWGKFTHPAMFTVPFDGPARAKRDAILAAFAAHQSYWRLTRLITCILTGL